MADSFEKFLLLCAPRETSDLGYAQVLKSGFLQRLNSPQFGVQMLHPTYPDSRTFPFWIESGAAAASRIIVRDHPLLSRFASPGRNRNVVFVNTPLPKPSPLELEPPHDSKSHYLPGAPPSFQVEDSILAADPNWGLHRRFYHECAPRSAGDTDRWRVVHTPPEQLDKASLARPADGWINPVVLEIELNSTLFEQPPEGVADTDPRAVIRREVLDKFHVLGLYPVLPRSIDAKLAAWEILLTSPPDGSKLNAVERLILGGVRGKPPRRESLISQLIAFFALDELRGQFSVYRHGTPKGPQQRRPRRRAASESSLAFAWWPPDDLQPNAVWFAEQAEAAWAAGRPLDRQVPDTPTLKVEGAPYEFLVGALKSRYSPPKRYEEPASRLSSLRQRWDPLVLDDEALLLSTPEPDYEPDEYDDAPREPLSPLVHWDEMRWVKSCLPRVRAEQSFKDFMLRLFEDERLRGHSVFSAIRRATRDPVAKGSGRWVSESNFEQLMETVGRDYVAPVSPIRFEIPIHLAATFESNQGKLEPRYFDLVNSLNDGGIGLLTGLLQPHRSETNQQNRERLILEPSAGWWNDWHLCLLGDPAELRLEFGAAGLTLGVSRLGEAPLGGSASAAAIPSVMSFTRPAPRSVALPQ